MYRISIERGFQARHALRMRDGSMEDAHSHHWAVHVEVESDQLDETGFVMDFHELARAIDRVLTPLADADLNELRELGGANPSAERVAEHIHQGVAPQLPAHVRLARVTVTEAPGCCASYVP